MSSSVPVYAGGEAVNGGDPDSILATATDQMNLDGDTIVVAANEAGSNSSTATGQLNPEGDTIVVANVELGCSSSLSTATYEVPASFRDISSASTGGSALEIPKTTGSSAPFKGQVRQTPGSTRCRSQPKRGVSSGVISGRVSRTKRQDNAQYACPYYIFDEKTHSTCRGAVLRGPADIRHHIKRKHKAPRVFCSGCWEIFGSTEQRAAHYLTPCDEKPFPKCWARQQDLEAIEPDNIDGNGAAEAWFQIFRALFPGSLGRLPTFHNARHQDVADCLSSFRHSPEFQEMVDGLRTNPLSKAWQIILDSILAFLRRGEISVSSAQVLEGTEAVGSHIASTASMQQSARPSDGQAGFQGVPNQPLSAESSGTFLSWLGPSRSHIHGRTQYRDSEFEVSASQAAQLQAIEDASASGQLASLNATGQVIPLDHPARTVFQTSKDGCMSPEYSFMSIDELFEQDALMQDSTHTLPFRTPVPQQTDIAGQESQTGPWDLGLDSDPGQFNVYVGDNAGADPSMGNMPTESYPDQSDTYAGAGDDVDSFLDLTPIDWEPALVDTYTEEVGDFNSLWNLESHEL